MPWSGYPRPIAPNLTRLVEESTTYAEAYALSSSTPKSLAALFASRYPSTLYRSGWFFADYPPSNLFLPQALTKGNVRTVAWQGHPYLKSRASFGLGFAVCESLPNAGAVALGGEITSPDLVALGMRLLAAQDDTHRFFAWTHFLDPHVKYLKHPECPNWGNQERDRYDSEICYTDRWLGNLLGFARTQAWWKDTVVIITADHGEAFGEHQMREHAFELWQPLVRVPLIIHIPGKKPQRVAARRSHLDLAPTILDLMGVNPAPTFLGKSLRPELLAERPADNREPIVLDSPADHHSPYRRAMVEGDYKLIERGAGNFLLFDLTRDPGEAQDLSRKQSEVLTTMRKKLEAVWQKTPAVEAYGGMRLANGTRAQGKMGPAQPHGP
jgi:arylsulfatase A-like enzyme